MCLLFTRISENIRIMMTWPWKAAVRRLKERFCLVKKQRQLIDVLYSTRFKPFPACNHSSMQEGLRRFVTICPIGTPLVNPTGCEDSFRPFWAGWPSDKSGALHVSFSRSCQLGPVSKAGPKLLALSADDEIVVRTRPSIGYLPSIFSATGPARYGLIGVDD
jgi:hypothetical protein